MNRLIGLLGLSCALLAHGGPQARNAQKEAKVFKKVDTVWCVATDMKRSVVFYKDLLGLKVTYESASWTSFDLGGLQLGLHGGESKSGGGGFVLGFECDDVKALRSKLAPGGYVVGGFHEIPRGVVLDIRDPDGNTLQATQLGVKVRDLGE